MLSHGVAKTIIAVIAVLSHLAITLVRASPPSGDSVAGLSEQVAAELVVQNIQCHENYGTNLDAIAADCMIALEHLDGYAQQYDTQRFEFGDEGVARRFPLLPSWNTPVAQPFLQGDCKIEVRMLPGAAHLPTDVATFNDLGINATKLMICLMYSKGGRSIAGESKDIGVYLYRPNSKFDKYLQAVSQRTPSSSPNKKLDLGDGAYIIVSDADPRNSICDSGATAPRVGTQRSGLLFGLDVVGTLLVGFCEAGS
ncbi:MAG: hypothetical protein M1835_005405 [Candelina submexicana]|nr:MAG: hypothetical protein M1835_005405 [Candelina submexicana]